MSKVKIWAIVAVMSAAMAGITTLQVAGIRRLIALNAATFDEQVFASLNRTADRLAERDNLDGYENGFSLQQVDRPRSRIISETEPTVDPGLGRPGGTRYQSPASIESWRELLRYNLELQGIPLGSRIQPLDLDAVIKQEFSNHGIRADFTYGVFDRELRDFIIIDGGYVVTDRGPTNRVEDDEDSDADIGTTTRDSRGASLETSPYAVDLFSVATAVPPGLLVAHFPNRSTIVLGELWWSIVVSAILLAIVLACFAYAVFIIFRQKRVSRMRNDFISNMTHEFKTPIATISLAADSITNARVIGSPEKIERFAGIIKAENQRMHRQVEKVLQAAQIERGEMQLRPVEVHLNSLVEEAADHMALQIDKRGGKLELELVAKHVNLIVDRTHLSNVIHNLIDNAIKYSPEELSITVRTEDMRGGVRVIVRDCGIGMTQEDQRQIFDSFFRVHTGNLHDVKGFGLGLSYVKATIEAHGGRVSVASTLGRGSTFTLELPLKPESQIAFAKT